jgi:hypothetical protein
VYYFFSLPVPANTLQSAPVVLRLPLDQGTVSFVEIHFPIGCAGLVSAILAYNSIQIVPWNGNSALFGDDRVFKLDINLPVKEPPFEFVIKGWSLDDTYPHTVTIGVMLVEENTVNMLQLLLGGK